MPHTIEQASTGRAKCRGCGQAIAKGVLRFGERVPNPYAEGEDAETTHWFHLWCGAYKRPEPFLEALGLFDGELSERAALESEARIGLEHRRTVRVDGASRAPSGRASCRACRETIEKASWRIGLVYYQDGRFAPSGYIHAGCAAAYLETKAVMPRIRHFSPELTDDDLAEIEDALGSP